MLGRQVGRYLITGELGRGGMGVVYKATQVTLNRTVAVKMLPTHLASSGEYLARFRREAEMLSRLSHENIVHIYDVDEVEGSHFIVMEYVSGPSLGAVLSREGRLAPPRARDITVAIAGALGLAHRKGVIHRDIKPDNILFTSSGRPKLTDFGIAHMRDGKQMTQAGTLLGTPYYMSPEQARGRPVTAASDIYSVGVVLYEMLAGQVPFTADDPLALALKHIQEEPPPLSRLAPHVSRAFCDEVHRALSKEPHERQQSVEELRNRLLSLELGMAAGLALGGSDVTDAGDGDERACPECRTPIRDEFLACPSCGLSIRERCDRCGRLYDALSPECPGCHAPATPPGTLRAVDIVVDAPRVPIVSVSGTPLTPVPEIAAEPAVAVAVRSSVSPAATYTGADRALEPAVDAPLGSTVGPSSGNMAGADDVAERQPSAIDALVGTLARRARGLAQLRPGAAFGVAARQAVTETIPGPPRRISFVPLLLWALLGVVGISAVLLAVADGDETTPPAVTLSPPGGGGGGSARPDPVSSPFNETPVVNRPSPQRVDSVIGSLLAEMPEVDSAQRDRAPNGSRPKAERPSSTPAPRAAPRRPDSSRARVPQPPPSAAEDEEDDDDDEPAAAELSKGSEEDAFDARVARRAIAEVIERQRRATETGNVELLEADLSGDLAEEWIPMLQELHRVTRDVSSAIREVQTEFDDATHARVRFRARVTATRKSDGRKVTISDGAVQWRLARLGNRWLITWSSD